MYRGTWLLVGLPLLIVAFSVERPPALPAPSLPPTFDGGAAVSLAQELARLYPDRTPGSAGSAGGVRWLTDKMRFFGFCPPTQKCALPTQRSDVFEARIPGLGKRRLQNISFSVDGRPPDAIVVMAHRDNDGVGPGANDNASGTAALAELARVYTLGKSARRLSPHTVVFLSTDAGTSGLLGAQRFAETYDGPIAAVVNLSGIGGSGRARGVIAGDAPRSPPPALVAA